MDAIARLEHSLLLLGYLSAITRAFAFWSGHSIGGLLQGILVGCKHLETKGRRIPSSLWEVQVCWQWVATSGPSAHAIPHGLSKWLQTSAESRERCLCVCTSSWWPQPSCGQCLSCPLPFLSLSLCVCAAVHAVGFVGWLPSLGTLLHVNWMSDLIEQP